MKNRLYEDAVRTLETYLEKYPNEEAITDLLLKAQTDNSVINRENTSGHITVSGFVLCDDKLLLIFHKKLQRYLQPGGHLEEDVTLLEAAQREVFEETGLSTAPFADGKQEVITPIHIDIHTIPYNEKKSEPEHMHYDCMFLLKMSNESEGVCIQESEVDGYKWVPLDYGFKDSGIAGAVNKIKQLM